MIPPDAFAVGRLLAPAKQSANGRSCGDFVAPHATGARDIIGPHHTARREIVARQRDVAILLGIIFDIGGDLGPAKAKRHGMGGQTQQENISRQIAPRQIGTGSLDMAAHGDRQKPLMQARVIAQRVKAISARTANDRQKPRGGHQQRYRQNLCIAAHRPITFLHAPCIAQMGIFTKVMQ